MWLEWRTSRVGSLKLATKQELCTRNYTRTENAHEVRKKLSFFNMWRLCEPLWSIRLNCRLMAKLEMMHILQAQVCGCISAYPGLPHQKTKRENSDASKSQLNQTNWNRTVLKFGSENQLKVPNDIFQYFLWFSHWSHDLENVTSLRVCLSVRRTRRV